MPDMIDRVVRALNLDPFNAEHRNMAKAAILSLREPTDAVIDAYYKVNLKAVGPKTTWQAMVDAAVMGWSA